MSDKRKYPRAEALAVAKDLCQLLTPHVDKIIVAGSLRRRKEEVGDVELLYIPKLVQGASVDFFGPAPIENLTEPFIEQLKLNGTLKPRPSSTGHFAWGLQNKLAIDTASGIPVDLFATTAEKWIISLVIRTGGKQTNLLLTTGAQKMNRKLHAYGVGVEVLRTGQMLIPQTEKDVFAFCNVPYREPKDRL